MRYPKGLSCGHEVFTVARNTSKHSLLVDMISLETPSIEFVLS